MADPDLQTALDALAESELQLGTVVDLAPVILIALDAGGICTLFRGAALDELGVASEEVLGTNLFAHTAEVAPAAHELMRRAYAGQSASGLTGAGDLAERVYETTYRPRFAADGTTVTGIIGISYDVTGMHRMARHDPLTGLANRARMEERLGEALARARRTGRAVALLYIDLDEFKLVNDTLGHAAGDELLCEVARRLDATTRAGDLVARQGGDEFMLLVEDLDGDAGRTAETVAANVLTAMEQPFTIDGTEFQVGASVGISMWPRHGEFPAELLQHADAALYQAKAEGRGVYATYDPATGSSRGRLTLTARLRKALARDEFELHYQPVFGLASGRQLAMEALVRWHDPERGLVLPAEFVPAAEGSGLIDDLGAWVLDEATRQTRAWIDAGLEPYVSVNISPRQLRDTGFAARIGAALTAHGIDSGRLMIEVTESAAMREPHRTDPLLREIADLGLRLAIDDFGTGHSSLARLQALPFEALKIDRSFLVGVPGSGPETRVMEAVLKLARALDMVVVAEGVETAAQREFLLAHGCEYAQGFLLGRPVPAAEIAPVMRRPG